MAYYMSLFTRETWAEARERVAFGVSGHTEAMYHRDEIGPGDSMICWIKGDSRAVGVQRTTTTAYEQFGEEERIWQSDIYPIRFGAELVLRVPVDEGVALNEIRDQSEDPDVGAICTETLVTGSRIKMRTGSWSDFSRI